MKRFSIVALVLFAVVLGGMGSAQAAFSIWFDENGNGRYSQNNGPWVATQGVMMVDPTTNWNALTYSLPEAVSPGGVRIWEGQIGYELSDALNFWASPASGLGMMSFYSIAPTNGAAPDKADVGIPAINWNDGGGVLEVNGLLVWTPSPNEYRAYSDLPLPPVPLPGAVWLLGPGLVGLASLKRRFKK